MAPHDAHLVLFEQELDAAEELSHDLITPATGDRVIETDRRRGDTKRLGVLQLVEQCRALQQRLCGDASAMQARAAHLVLFDERDAKPQLRCSERRRVASHASTENRDVEPIRHGAQQYMRVAAPFRHAPYARTATTGS